ncbi:MAG: anti-sigma factor antagonist [Oscillospiraceae bacterium]|nr:anti-sigma factor antagonist [Oscillospiraceae bacterium]
MAVNFKMQGDIATAFLSGEIDHHSAKQMREKIDAFVEENSPKLLVLDFGEISFMDSSGIGIVMGRFKLMKSLGGAISIENASSHVSRVMKMAGLDRLTKL